MATSHRSPHAEKKGKEKQALLVSVFPQGSLVPVQVSGHSRSATRRSMDPKVPTGQHFKWPIANDVCSGSRTRACQLFPSFISPQPQGRQAGFLCAAVQPLGPRTFSRPGFRVLQRQAALSLPNFPLAIGHWAP